MLFAVFHKLTTRSARCLGLGILLAALPIAATASTITVDFSAGGLVSSLSSTGTATGVFTYDSAAATAMASPFPYVAPGSGLDSFSLTYGGETFTDNTSTTAGQLLDPGVLPTVLLPGNALLPPGDNYAIEALWVISGSCTGSPSAYTCTGPGGVGDATVLGFSREFPAFIATNVTGADIGGSGVTYSGELLLAPSVTFGTVTIAPEPAYLPLTVLAIAGLCFISRRKLKAQRS
jgi:hypothetical protein